MPTAAPTSAPTEVDPATVIDWMRDPDAITVLDVRSPAEFATRHIAEQLLDRLPTAKCAERS